MRNFPNCYLDHFRLANQIFGHLGQSHDLRRELRDSLLQMAAAQIWTMKYFVVIPETGHHIILPAVAEVSTFHTSPRLSPALPIVLWVRRSEDQGVDYQETATIRIDSDGSEAVALPLGLPQPFHGSVVGLYGSHKDATQAVRTHYQELGGDWHDVHVLEGGAPRCKFSEETPNLWPPGHTWVGPDHPYRVTCDRCWVGLWPKP